MIEETQPRKRNHKRLWLALMVLAAILIVLIVPPFLSVTRYKAQITHLISASLGRPVRLSSVEVRLLPRPGFVLTDLTVEEDPAYGAEPVLHAETVTASIRLLSLWRGHVALDTISVDNASLNLVRTPAGRWNLDSLLRTATAPPQSAATGETGSEAVKLPYLEATNSRINLKNGVEKLPFSLLSADLSFWQQSPGDWRVRLRGQPARTDLTIEQGDTGIVRLEADLHQATQLRQMPLHIDLEWREAQLGQLTRLLLGTDSGWRGDLTGELQVDGTAEAAQIKSRLRATGVHRAEFTPVAPMDFDANCTLVAHFSTRAIDNLLCDSQLGSGRIRLSGNQPGNQHGNQPGSLSGIHSVQPSITVELDRIPVAFGLDALRTVRSGLAPGLEAVGAVSGKITYAPAQPEKTASERPTHAHPVKARTAAQGPLTGSLTVLGLQLSGNGLSQSIRIPKFVLEPEPTSQPQALTATVAIPVGATVPLTVSTRLALSGYQLTMRGQASIARGRELMRVAGLANVAALDEVAGDPASVDLIANGPWMLLPTPVQSPVAPADTLTGTVTLRNANWKADYLANHIEISEATLHLASDGLRWDPVAFSYGPVKGTATLTLPAVCDAPQPCTPQFQVNLGALDAAVLQAALLGARERGTLLSTLLERLRPTSTPAWPLLQGTVKADSLILGPATFDEPEATLLTLANGVEITAFDATLLGGRVHGSAKLQAAATAKGKPAYAFEAQFEKLNPQAVGQLLGLRASGGDFAASGKIELTGYTGDDLASSAIGALHFEWRHGSIRATSGSMPSVLERFDRWSADAEIANGALTLKENQVKSGARTGTVQASVPLAEPPRISFSAGKPAPTRH
ncbi:MAG: AsmA family protein [Terracidiphilus sp.]|jgi:hypothetical protein